VTQLAKTPTTASQTKPTNVPLIPMATDPRAELFWLLGRIEGQGVEGAARIVSLVIELTAVAPPAETGGE
jgi:hypothetical protein